MFLWTRGRDRRGQDQFRKRGGVLFGLRQTLVALYRFNERLLFFFGGGRFWVARGVACVVARRDDLDKVLSKYFLVQLFFSPLSSGGFLNNVVLTISANGLQKIAMGKPIAKSACW